MADESISTNPEAARTGRPPGGREGGGRDSGGFRIRLSDNEMQAARALQEAFGLRSTVAVLGFSLRTLAQQLEQGQLSELIAQHQAQVGGRPPASREGSRGGGGERRRDRFPGEREEGRGGGRGARVDPFARPSRPAAPPAEAEPASEIESAAEPESAAAEPIAAEAMAAEASADETSAAPEQEPDAAPEA
jgi:hypothetical protein